MRNCPNLEHLGVPTKIPEIVQFISINNPKIEHLSIDAIRTEDDADAKFSFLNYLHVRKIKNYKNLQLFVKNNPTIETLSVRLLIDERTDIGIFIGALLSQPNLKHLKFMSNLEVAKAINDKVKAVGSLKSLVLRNYLNYKRFTEDELSRIHSD